MTAQRRVLISADLEGVAGVVASEELRPGNAEFERARLLMTEEVNAAIAGVLGAEEGLEVVVADSHGSFRNILQDRLDPAAKLLRGKPRALAMVEEIERADAVIFVGYHARAGQSGVLSHTFNDTVRDVRCNGRSFGEAGLNAAVASHFGVPLLLATGDDALVDEVSDLTPRTMTVAVKRAVSAFAAESLHPTVACRLIEVAAHAAVQQWEGGLVDVQGPVDVAVDLSTPGQADRAALPPPVARASATTVQVHADSMVTAYRWVRTITALAAHIG